MSIALTTKTTVGRRARRTRKPAVSSGLTLESMDRLMGTHSVTLEDGERVICQHGDTTSNEHVRRHNDALASLAGAEVHLRDMVEIWVQQKRACGEQAAEQYARPARQALQQVKQAKQVLALIELEMQELAAAA